MRVFRRFLVCSLLVVSVCTLLVNQVESAPGQYATQGYADTRAADAATNGTYEYVALGKVDAAALHTLGIATESYAADAGSTPTFTGDMTNSGTVTTVAKVHGTTYPAGGALTTGQVPRVTAADAVLYGAVDIGNSNAVTGTLAAANQAAQTMTGDVTGTTAAAVVAKVNGTTVPAGGSLTTGNACYVSGGAACTYSALNLAGGAGYVSGVLPAANRDSPTAAETVTALASAASDIAINTHKITGLSAGTTSGHAVEYAQMNTAIAARVPYVMGTVPACGGWTAFNSIDSVACSADAATSEHVAIGIKISRAGNVNGDTITGFTYPIVAGSSWTVGAGMAFGMAQAGGAQVNGASFGVTDGTKFMQIGLATSGGSLFFKDEYFSSSGVAGGVAQTLVDTPVTDWVTSIRQGDLWYAYVVCDGTNLTYRMSRMGRVDTSIKLYTEAKGAHLGTVTAAAISMRGNNSGGAAIPTDVWVASFTNAN